MEQSNFLGIVLIRMEMVRGEEEVKGRWLQLMGIDNMQCNFSILHIHRSSAMEGSQAVKRHRERREGEKARQKPTAMHPNTCILCTITPSLFIHSTQLNEIFVVNCCYALHIGLSYTHTSLQSAPDECMFFFFFLSLLPLLSVVL